MVGIGEIAVVAGIVQFVPSALYITKREFGSAGSVLDKRATKREPLKETSKNLAETAAAGTVVALFQLEPSVLITRKFATVGRDVGESPVATQTPFPYAMPVA